MKTIGLIIILLVQMAFSVFAEKEFYVSPNGNDNNPGSIDRPFLSFEKAKEAVRLFVAKNPGQNITVYFRKGDYFIENTLQFSEQDCSTNAHIKYTAYKNETVVINGGVAITGWEKWKDNVYSAKLPAQLKGKPFYRLYINSESAVLARHPNRGDGFGGGMKRINNTTINVPEDWKNYDFSNAQIYGWIGSNWFAEVRAAQSFNIEKCMLLVDPGANNYGGLNHRIYIQGVPELLDIENEWCIKNDSVYYYPTNETDLNKQLIVAPTQARLIEIKGSNSKKWVENISFEHLHFQGSNFTNAWRIFRPGKEATMPDHLQEGLIYIENAKNISIQYCNIKGAGHSAVYINNKSESCTVYGCIISDAGFCGIYLNSHLPGIGDFESVQDSYINKHHNLSNNFIHHCGISVGGGCGIQLYQSGDNNITHNVICEMPRYGISYKGIRNGALIETLADRNINYVNHFDYIHTRNNYIAYNEIFNVCRSSFDFGAIESWGAGKGNVWDCNAIHDIDQTVDWDGWAHGLFTDDGSDFVTLKNNIVFELKGGKSTGAVMVKSISQEVSNNIFADNAIGRAATMAPYAEPAKNSIVHKNIFYHSGKLLYDTNYRTFKLGFYGYYENDYNKEYVKGEPVFDKVDYNLIYPDYEQLDSLKKYDWDVHSVIGKPMFEKRNKQWDVTHLDYKLNPESPAYKLGFEKINYDSIGLLNDFPFERKLVRNAGSIIQAESYNRMHGLRPIGATSIYHMEEKAWAKYENMDFGKGEYRTFTCAQNVSDEFNSSDIIFEIRLNSPTGKLIGTVNKNDKQINIKKVKGVQNLFLVFQKETRLNHFRFEKE